MKKTLEEMGKQYFSLLRCIAFVPLGFWLGFLVQVFFALVTEFISFGRFDSTNYWSGSAFFVQGIGWLATYISSLWIKPKFVTTKAFIICWCLIIGIFSISAIQVFLDPSVELPLHREIYKALIPAAVLFWFVRDKNNGLYALEKSKNKK